MPSAIQTKFVAEEAIKLHNEAPKTIIFANTAVETTNLFFWFMNNLENDLPAKIYFAIFCGCKPTEEKEYILNNFVKTEFPACV